MDKKLIPKYVYSMANFNYVLFIEINFGIYIHYFVWVVSKIHSFMFGDLL
jgi:hypothetical protein